MKVDRFHAVALDIKWNRNSSIQSCIMPDMHVVSLLWTLEPFRSTPEVCSSSGARPRGDGWIDRTVRNVLADINRHNQNF